MTLAITRRALGAGLLAMPALARAATDRVRIGYQKNGSLPLLKQQRRLEAAGLDADWAEFPSGPPLLEALNAGAVDFGATGDTPPIFAQAAGSRLLYVGGQPVTGRNEAVLVRADGPIKTIADLRGKAVAFARGSSAHYVIVKVLQKAGLGIADVKPLYMQPPDAGAAFRTGAIDAWSIWDPFYAMAETEPGTRVLTSAEGIAPSNSFFLASRDFAARTPRALQTVLDQINAVAAWAQANPEPLAEALSTVTGVPLPVQRVSAARGIYIAQPIDDAIIARQQEVADTFAALHIIPAKVDIRSAVWRPQTKQASNTP
jgi:aliphatic sulfonates family ABC transporter substrate-binding protein